MKQVFFHSTGQAIPVSNIFCIGRNYAAHAAELGNKPAETPIVFLKPTSSLNLEGNLIYLPTFSNEVHYEAELVVLIKQACKQIEPKDALNYVGGYGVGLDLTARDLQTFAKDRGLPWTLAKGFDYSACVSGFIPPSEFKNPNHFTFELKQNGIIRQQGDTTFMLFDVPYLISYLSTVFSLQAGDLIFTGTPEGVGKVNKGDRIELGLADKLRATFWVSA